VTAATPVVGGASLILARFVTDSFLCCLFGGAFGDEVLGFDSVSDDVGDVAILLRLLNVEDAKSVVRFVCGWDILW
jgi:hypothetical protein